MKYLLICLSVVAVAGSIRQDTKNYTMEKATIVEMVMFSTHEGVSKAQGQEALIALGDFVSSQPGFVSRKVSQSAEGQYLDLVFWVDLQSAKTAAAKAMQAEHLKEHFGVIDQQSITFEHFEVFYQQ